MKGLLIPWRIGLAAVVGLLTINVTARAAETGSMASHYTLLAESRFIDRCPICGRPEIPLPLTGSFRLRLMQVRPALLHLRRREPDLGGQVQPGADDTRSKAPAHCRSVVR